MAALKNSPATCNSFRFSVLLSKFQNLPEMDLPGSFAPEASIDGQQQAQSVRDEAVPIPPGVA